MNHEQFDHVLRAAGNVLGETELTVIGSQAILAVLPPARLMPEVVRSVEVDLLPFDDPDGVKADEIDGAIGEASSFQERFGVYADGVGELTAVAPDGWRNRTVVYTSAATGGVVAHCMAPVDLCASKLIAGRVKDVEFVRAVLEYGLVSADEVVSALHAVSAASEQAREVAITRARGLAVGLDLD